MEGTPRGVHIEYDMLQSGRDTVVWSKNCQSTPHLIFITSIYTQWSQSHKYLICDISTFLFIVCHKPIWLWQNLNIEYDMYATMWPRHGCLVKKLSKHTPFNFHHFNSYTMEPKSYIFEEWHLYTYTTGCLFHRFLYKFSVHIFTILLL